MDRSQYTTLVEALSDVPDSRRRRGIRHSWGLLLTLIGAAMLSGQSHARAVAQWVSEHSQQLAECLQTQGGRLPSESTLRRALRMVDVEALEARLGGFAAGLEGSAEGMRGQAIDGKQLRGARAHGRLVHLISLMSQEDGWVLAQAEVAPGSGEVAAVPHLLEGRELTGTLITVDALLAQRELARQILKQGGHYLMVIKHNQPETHETIAELFENPPWLPAERQEQYWVHHSFEKGHGRLETRVLESSSSLNEYLCRWLQWPGVGQAMRRTYERVMLGTGQVSQETSYAITSLGHEQAGCAQLEGYWRGHWGIENRLHWVWDVTMGEDRGRAYTGSTPHALAALRNGIIGLLRASGWTRIADALRHYNAHPDEALRLIGALPSRL